LSYTKDQARKYEITALPGHSITGFSLCQTGEREKLNVCFSIIIIMADEKFTCIKDFEEYATTHLPPDSRIFTNHGADEEVTMRDNVEAFKR
jgi:hypothetical protein